jgi:hypothetical protein
LPPFLKKLPSEAAEWLILQLLAQVVLALKDLFQMVFEHHKKKMEENAEENADTDDVSGDNNANSTDDNAQREVCSKNSGILVLRNIFI